MVQHHKYSPNEIVAVTFTNKSANEMRKRLQKLLGDQQADHLVLGKLDLWERVCTYTEFRYIPRDMCQVLEKVWQID